MKYPNLGIESDLDGLIHILCKWKASVSFDTDGQHFINQINSIKQLIKNTNLYNEEDKEGSRLTESGEEDGTNSNNIKLYIII